MAIAQLERSPKHITVVKVSEDLRWQYNMLTIDAMPQVYWNCN
jgi:hypothetical protein